MTAKLNATSCDGHHTEWYTNVEYSNHETLKHIEFKFTWPCHLFSAIVIYQLQNSHTCWNVRVFLGIINVDRYEKMNKYTTIIKYKKGSFNLYARVFVYVCVYIYIYICNTGCAVASWLRHYAKNR